jgi:hypothetical protein
MREVRQAFHRVGGTRSAGGLDPVRFRAMVHSIVTARPDEIGCAACFEHMARYVEVVWAGARAAEVMPLVHDHLTRCRDCRQEYQALLVAVRATT